MSQSECERFAADLQSNEELRAEAGKVQADKSPESPLIRMVALALNKGYSVTIEEAREHLKAKAAATGKVLSDAELDGVAAGGDADVSDQRVLGHASYLLIFCLSSLVRTSCR